MARKRETNDEQSADTDGPDASGVTCSRREYVGATAAMVTPVVRRGDSATTTDYGITFPTVVNAVADLGLDPTGADPVGDRLEAVDDALVEFPDGAYRFEQPVEVDGRIGLRAVGEHARLIAPPMRGTVLLDASGPEPVSVDGFDIDQRRAGAVAGLRLRGRRVVARDLGVRGPVQQRRSWLPVLDVASADGRVRVDGLHVEAGPQLGRPGIVFPAAHSGRATAERVSLKGFEGAAVHGPAAPGRVSVRESVFRDNAVAIRLSGPGTVERCRIALNRSPPARPGERSRPYLRNGVTVGTAPGDRASGPVRVADTTIRLGTDTAAGAGLTVTSNGSHVAVVRSRIEMDTPGRAGVLVRQPDGGPTSGVRLRETAVTGSGDLGAAVELAEAGNSLIRGATVTVAGSGTDGLRITGGDGVSVRETDLAVEGRAIRAVDTEIDAAGLSGWVPDGQSPSRDSAHTTLTIVGPETPARYEVTATGSVSRLDGDGGYGPTGTTAEGVVASETVQFAIEGLVTQFSVDGRAEVSVDGEQVEPSSLGVGPAGGLECQPRTEYVFAADQLWSRGDSGRVVGTARDGVVRHSFHGTVSTLAIRGTGDLWHPLQTD